MQRTRMISIPLKKGTKAKLQLRDWGIERSYITPSGNEICKPAPFEELTKIYRKFIRAMKTPLSQKCFLKICFTI